MSFDPLPIPSFFAPEKVGEVWRVPYQQRATEALTWAKQYQITPAWEDQLKICLLAIDVQNTFCIPGFELYVAGRSGQGAIEDNRRLCAFIYRNLHQITEICPTLDTHQAMQIFHSLFLSDEAGNHPEPFSLISVADLKSGRWRFNPALAPSLQIRPEDGQHYLQYYVDQLEAEGKYQLTIWPYHSMLGGIGHALVSAVEEAIFFHGIARVSQPDFQIKGDNPFTENYSVLRPEVLDVPINHKKLPTKNVDLLDKLIRFDVIILAGQAKSHCLAWTIEDLLGEMRVHDERLTRKVYLLEDCTSPVVVPGMDYTEVADAAFRRFAEAGMHVVRSEQPMSSWPDLPKRPR